MEYFILVTTLVLSLLVSTDSMINTEKVEEKANHSQLSKIIGGDVVRTNYPYMISVQISNLVQFLGIRYHSYIHNCGGSILTPNYILTAGM